MRRMDSAKASGSSSSGVMSLKTMPWLRESRGRRECSAARSVARACTPRPRSWTPLHVLQLDRTPELVERARLDLPHALARDPEVLAGLRERARHAVVEAVADAEDLLLALAQRAQQPVDLLVLELELDETLDRGRRLAQILGR